MNKIAPISGLLCELEAGIQRLTSSNAGLMTGPGTNTYILGKEETIVIDPGPEIPEHIDKILECTNGNIFSILVTHTHFDHSPATCLLAKETGAKVLGISPPPLDHQDMTFFPDQELKDGDTLETKELKLTAIYTPGHASNHMCYFHDEYRCLFSGDHIIDGSTVVINPPDGDMGDYLNSLERIRLINIENIFPGHGSVIDNPREVIEGTIKHRIKRELKVIECLKVHPKVSLSDLVQYVYEDTDKSLYFLAERSLLAHLLKLKKEGRSNVVNDCWQLFSSN